MLRQVRTTNVTSNSVRTSNSNDNIVYSDININAGTISPREIVTNIDSVNQNILVILGTQKKSWWWGPDKGGYIGKLLFEPIDEDTANKLRSEIIDSLRDNNEYRVVYNSVYVEAHLTDQEYYVHIIYDVPELRLKDVPFAFNLAQNF